MKQNVECALGLSLALAWQPCFWGAGRCVLPARSWPDPGMLPWRVPGVLLASGLACSLGGSWVPLVGWSLAAGRDKNMNKM